MSNIRDLTVISQQIEAWIKRLNFAYNILKCIFLTEKFSISSQMSLKFAPNGPIDNIAPLVLVMLDAIQVRSYYIMAVHKYDSIFSKTDDMNWNQIIWSVMNLFNLIFLSSIHILTRCKKSYHSNKIMENE